MPTADQLPTCLHFVATASESALSDCLNQAIEGDAIVLIDSGVMHLVKAPEVRESLNHSGICFSFEDLEARGLTPIAREQGFAIRDDRTIVRMLSAHSHCLTWK